MKCIDEAISNDNIKKREKFKIDKKLTDMLLQPRRQVQRQKAGGSFLVLINCLVLLFSLF